MTTKIDKGIPMPTPKSGPGSRSPFWDMQVGDSVFFAGESTKPSGYFKTMVKNGWKFSQRKVAENGVAGIRVWRIA